VCVAEEGLVAAPHSRCRTRSWGQHVSVQVRTTRRVHNARIVGSGDYTCDALRARREHIVAARSSQDTDAPRFCPIPLCAGDEQGTYTEGQDTYHSCVETQHIRWTNILFLAPSATPISATRGCLPHRVVLVLKLHLRGVERRDQCDCDKNLSTHRNTTSIGIKDGVRVE
jgi:hypothetical protein